MISIPGKCPVCDGELQKVDIPKHRIYSCTACHELCQVAGESMVPLGDLLSKAALGDDRIQSAISKPHVSDISSFIEIFENSIRMQQMEMAAASGGLRTILAQIENRIDFALGTFTGLDLASDDAANGLRMLREARELVSTLPSRNRGVQEASDGDGEVRS